MVMLRFARRGRIIVWVCLAALLATCAGLSATPPFQTTTQSPPPARSGSRPGFQFMVSGSDAELQGYRALVAVYQQRQPGQMVELVGIPGEADYQKRLAADIAAGRPADVILEGYTHVTGLAARGILAPVAADLAASRVLKLTDFAPGTLAPFIVDRLLQCVPVSASGLVVYFNHDLFAMAGLPDPGPHWTREEFVADARRLTRDSDGDGRTDQYGLGLAPSLTNLAPFILQLKGSLVDLAPWPTELALGTPIALTATTWLVSLQSQYHVVPAEADELAASSLQRFLDGSLAMLVDTRARVPDLRQISGFAWDAAGLPADNTSTSNVIIADGLCLTAASTNKAAAWQFIEFAASAEGQALLARSGAIVPALSAVADSPDFLDAAGPPAHNRVFLEAR